MTATSTPTLPDVKSSPSDALLRVLFVELFQTEESADGHTQAEAERLVGTPPAAALLAVAHHAREQRPALEALAASQGFAPTTLGARIGSALSAARQLIVDRTVSREKSYRGTIIGMRHGVDLVHLIRATAHAAGREAVVACCDRWLAERVPLVEAVVAELGWFGANADRACERAARPLV